MMGLGFSKIFVLVLIFSLAYGYYTYSIKATLTILIPFIILRIIWKALTK